MRWFDSATNGIRPRPELSIRAENPDPGCYIRQHLEAPCAHFLRECLDGYVRSGYASRIRALPDSSRDALLKLILAG